MAGCLSLPEKYVRMQASEIEGDFTGGPEVYEISERFYPEGGESDE